MLTASHDRHNVCSGSLEELKTYRVVAWSERDAWLVVVIVGIKEEVAKVVRVQYAVAISRAADGVVCSTGLFTSLCMLEHHRHFLIA